MDIEFELQEQDADAMDEEDSSGSEGEQDYASGEEDDDDDDDEYFPPNDSDEEIYLGTYATDGQPSRVEAAERIVDLRYIRAATFQQRQCLQHPLACEIERATHATTCTLGPEAVACPSPEKRSPVNATKMLLRREANSTGAGRFRKSDCCHLGLRHIPQHSPVVRDEMHSRGYIGQFSENGEWFIGGFQGTGRTGAT